MRSPSRSLPRIVLLALALLVGAGLAGGVGAALAADPSASPDDGKATLNVGWTTDPDNLNPFVGIEQSSYELFHISYDFLTHFGDEFLETVPGLAESWESSDDGLTWTFTIREGVTWDDGEPLTASDVAFSFNFQRDLELSAFLAALDGIEEVTAPDDRTVVIRCSRPKADILAMWVPIIPEHIWSELKTYDEVQQYLNAPPIVGSGPFQVVEWDKGKFVRCVANEDYWGGAPKVDEVVFSVYKNQDTLAQDLKLGTIDLAINIPPAQVAALAGDANLEADACSQKAFDYLSFNCYEGPSLGNPVLKDPAFRQALNWGIDKAQMAELAYQGYADPATSLFEVDFYDPELDWHWQPPAEVEYRYDPDKAKELLDAAGYKDSDGDGVLNDPNNGDRNISLRLWARTESPQSQTMGKLITGWWEELGVDIQFSVEQNGVLIDGGYNYDGDTYKPDYDIYIWTWQPSGSDPGRRLGYFRTEQIENQNDACWSNPEYDRLWEEQSQELDPQKRLEIVHRMQEIFYTESPYIVLTYPKLLQAWNTSEWEGWRRIPEGSGAIAFLSDNVSNYYKVGPVGAESSAGGFSTGVLIGIVVAVVAVIAIVLLVVRSRPKAEEH